MNLENADNNKTIGARLKKSRLLAGLSRKDLASKYGISASTVQSWEIGRNTLTEKGANRIISAFEQEGLICSKEWILKGEGTSPKFVDDVDHFVYTNKDDVYLGEEEAIAQEISIFKSSNNNSVVIYLNDDSMHPLFLHNSYVGGIFADSIDKFLGKPCIVEIEDGNLFLRKVVASTAKDKYNLFVINPEYKGDPILQNQKVRRVAPVIWCRNKFSAV